MSGKQAEEVGFDKFARRQAELRGIHVLVLDRMRIRHRIEDERDTQTIAGICANITDLDLSGNLFESAQEIVSLCSALPKLQNLTLDGNRLDASNSEKLTSQTLPGVRTLGLSSTLLSPDEVNDVLTRFPQIQELILASNGLSNIKNLQSTPDLRRADLSADRFEMLADLSELNQLEQLRTIILKGNMISGVCTKSHHHTFGANLEELDLSYNGIDDWSFFNDLPAYTPGLRHLRVTGNPLYEGLKSADGKPLTAEDGYMLTVARLPQLETLNYSKVTEKERLNAETYYLNQIVIELSNAGAEKEAEVLIRHPRWQALCDEYGEPAVTRKHGKTEESDPNSLAAKLVSLDLYISSLQYAESRRWVEEIPKSMSIYSLLGIVAKHLMHASDVQASQQPVNPLNLRLIWETDDFDPIGHGGYNGPEWWDSDDEAESTQDGQWTARQLELTASTRAVGTYIEGRKASIRVEMRDWSGS